MIFWVFLALLPNHFFSKCLEKLQGACPHHYEHTYVFLFSIGCPKKKHSAKALRLG